MAYSKPKSSNGRCKRLRMEIEGITAIKTRRSVRGRAGTVIIEADFQKDGQSVERREIALCNESRGAPLAEEIRVFLRGVTGARPVIVRPRGGRLPRSGRFIAPLMREAEEMHSIIVPQFEMVAWERLDSARHFFRNFKDAAGFEQWQRDARPLTRTLSLAEIVQYPYVKAVTEDEPEEEVAEVRACAEATPQGSDWACRHARRPCGWRTSPLGAVRNGIEAFELRHSRHGRSRLG